jgi:hypothetical protein
MNVLLELVHETTKLLDLCRKCFTSESEANFELSNVAPEISNAFNHALIFDSSEYFSSKMVSAHSVSMYTRALALYRSNSAKINHYIFSYMQRLSNLRINRELEEKDVGGKPTTTLSGTFMLFNIETLAIFSTILNDPAVARQAHLRALVALMKQITRHFSDAVARNRFLFVEILLSHPNSFHRAIEDIDSVYKASTFVSECSAHGDSQRDEKSKRYRNDHRAFNSSDDEPDADVKYGSGDSNSAKKPLLQPANIFGISLEGDDSGEEEVAFDENNLPEVFQASVSGKRVLSAEDKRQNSVKGKRRRKAKWTEAEDLVLRRKFSLFDGSSSAFDMLAAEPELISFGNDRLASDVKRRCHKLKLHIGANYPEVPSSNVDVDVDMDKTETADIDTGLESPIDGKGRATQKYGSPALTASTRSTGSPTESRTASPLAQMSSDLPIWENDEDDDDDKFAPKQFYRDTGDTARHSASGKSKNLRKKKGSNSDGAASRFAADSGNDTDQENEQERALLRSDEALVSRKLPTRKGRVVEDSDDD